MYYSCNLNQNSKTYAHVKIVTLIWIQIQNDDLDDFNLVTENVYLNVSFPLMYCLFKIDDNLERYYRLKYYLDKERNR